MVSVSPNFFRGIHLIRWFSISHHSELWKLPGNSSPENQTEVKTKRHLCIEFNTTKQILRTIFQPFSTTTFKSILFD